MISDFVILALTIERLASLRWFLLVVNKDRFKKFSLINIKNRETKTSDDVVILCNITEKVGFKGS